MAQVADVSDVLRGFLREHPEAVTRCPGITSAIRVWHHHENHDRPEGVTVMITLDSEEEREQARSLVQSDLEPMFRDDSTVELIVASPDFFF